MNLRVRLTIEFDDDKGTIVKRTVYLKNIQPIDPTYAIVKALIEYAEA